MTFEFRHHETNIYLKIHTRGQPKKTYRYKIINIPTLIDLYVIIFSIMQICHRRVINALSTTSFLVVKKKNVFCINLKYILNSLTSTKQIRPRPMTFPRPVSSIFYEITSFYPNANYCSPCMINVSMFYISLFMSFVCHGYHNNITLFSPLAIRHRFLRLPRKFTLSLRTYTYINTAILFILI